MTTVSSRAIGAIVGGLIADAAGIPIHWNYDPSKLSSILAQYDKPEFIPEGHCPFYKIPTGSSSCHGDQSYVMLKSLVKSKGFDVSNLKAGLKDCFGPGTAYDIDQKGPRPVSGPWKNHCLATFLANYAENKEKTGDVQSKDMDSLSLLVPLVALYAGDPKLTEYAETTARITQDNEASVKYTLAGVKLLEGYILNGRNPKAAEDLIAGSVDPEVKAELQDVISCKDEPHAPTVKKFGTACSMPGSLKGALHAILNANDDFAASLRPTMTAGGENCSRLLYAGACLGAQGGVESLPSDWLSKTDKVVEGKALAEELVKLRK